jgi:ketosteroid isomerase-like protein
MSMSVAIAEEDILKNANARAAALVRRDADIIASLLSSDFVYTNSSGVLFNKREYIDAFVIDPAVVWRGQQLQVHEIRMIGDIAVVVGRVHDEATFAGLLLDAEFATTQVYHRHNGRWLYLAGHTSSIKGAEA